MPNTADAITVEKSPTLWGFACDMPYLRWVGLKITRAVVKRQTLNCSLEHHLMGTIICVECGFSWASRSCMPCKTLWTSAGILDERSTCSSSSGNAQYGVCRRACREFGIDQLEGGSVRWSSRRLCLLAGLLRVFRSSFLEAQCHILYIE